MGGNRRRGQRRQDSSVSTSSSSSSAAAPAKFLQNGGRKRRLGQPKSSSSAGTGNYANNQSSRNASQSSADFISDAGRLFKRLFSACDGASVSPTMGSMDAADEGLRVRIKTVQESLSGLCVLSRVAGAKLHLLEKSPAALLAVFRTFGRKPGALQSACDLVWSLAYNDPTAQGRFAQSHVCNCVLNCAKEHAKNKSMMKSAYGALSSLCRHNDNQNIAHKERAHVSLLKVLDEEGYGDPVLTQYTLDAMASMSHGHAKNARMLLEAKAIPRVLKTIDKNAHSAEIVRSGCIVLVVLRECTGGSEMIVSGGAIRCVLKASREHLEKYEMQHILCALMGQLVREVPSAASLLVADAADPGREHGATLLLGVLSRYPEHWLISEACCLLVQASATLPLTCPQAGGVQGFQRHGPR